MGRSKGIKKVILYLKKSLRKNIIKTFVFGLMVFVLIILAGIMTGISLIPVTLLAYLFGGGIGVSVILSVLGLVIGIYFLGFVFERFKVRMKKR